MTLKLMTKTTTLTQQQTHKFEQFLNQEWRIDNLYKIIDKQGNEISFRMNDIQREFFHNKHNFNVILKARQLGFSTFILIYILDCCLFYENTSAGVIAQGLKEAEDLFRNKVKYAYDRIPEPFKSKITATSNSARMLEFSNGSSITIGTSLRGGTFQKLHISEHGKIAARTPDKAVEIKTGALNTVHSGQEIFIESTAEGQQGEFYDLVQQGKKLLASGAELTPMDPKLFFFPWYKDPSYQIDAEVSINADMAAYFQKLGHDLTPHQKAWYVKKADQQGEYMKREFPSTPDEAFEQSMEGAIYHKQMMLVRERKQIGYFPHDPSKRVFTFWDLGKGSDATSIWFMQQIGEQIRFIDYHESHNEGWDFYAKLLAAKPYVYECHYLPHDGDTSTVGKVMSNPKKDLTELGVSPIKVVPRTRDLWADIKGPCRQKLVNCHFDEKHCSAGIKHLDNYRREWDDKLGVWKDKPRHDEASHGSDAYRTFVMGYTGPIQEAYSHHDYSASLAVASSDEDLLDW